MGAQMVKEVASKTADEAGDGTTTATVLAQSIVSTGLKNVTAGANPMIPGLAGATKIVLTNVLIVDPDRISMERDVDEQVSGFGKIVGSFKWKPLTKHFFRYCVFLFLIPTSYVLIKNSNCSK